MACLEVGQERLVSARGTIIPMGLRFDDGSTIVMFATGVDAFGEPSGAERTAPGADVSQPLELPLRRVASCGKTDGQRALLFDQYLFHLHDNHYQLFYTETVDAGRSFTGVKQAVCHIPNLIHKPYMPDANSHYKPSVPEWYLRQLGHGSLVIGGHLFGRMIRLRDGGLVLTCYGALRGNMQRPRIEGDAPTAGVAPEGADRDTDSSLLLRSDDEGRSWHYVATIAALSKGRPFDGGLLYSEGFNETALAQTSDGELLAIVRHGSYHLLWENRSNDDGQTWATIQPLNHPGVAPSMVMMDNGILAAAWGRPGMTVAFSLDGTGRKWDLATELMRDDQPSQKYPWLDPVGADRVRVYYDKRRWNPQTRTFYDHGIFARDLQVRR